MEPEKEKWINDVLGSLNNIQQAEPSPFLFAKIQNRLVPVRQTVYVSTRTVWLVAASFAFLTLLNWQVIDQSVLPITNHTKDLNTVISDMQLYPATNQLYDVWSEQNY
ncbi:hypothetical protein [Spirosoma flavum]|uniref:Anti-sigma factor n=1 Tax=Spirosoma flavum TaxID=2048557 RepID=A0ABW6AAJ4_9BACT